MKKRDIILFFLFPALCIQAADKDDLDSFQKVWDTVQEKHWDLEGLGVDWQAVYEKYKPLAEAATSRLETRAVITDMLGELGQSHFQILESDDFEALEDIRGRLGVGNATPGFEAALVDDRVFVVALEPGYSAEETGMKIGMEILKVNDDNLSELLPVIRKAYANSNHAEMYTKQTLNQLFKGFEGGNLRVTVADDPDPREIQLKLADPPGRFMEILNLSVFYRYESRVLDDQVGYVAFNVFVPDVKMAFDGDLKTNFTDTKGLIIDLRGNPGGLGFLAAAIARRLVAEKGKRLGQMVNSGGTLNFALFPEKPIYDKPVAVLIDSGSASTSEILAAGLQDLGRARVFGTRSAGAALPSYIEVLPNGDRFQYAIADYISFKGQHLEGNGVEPDQATPHTIDSMEKGIDATMQAATAWIQEAANEGANHEDL